MDLEKCASVHKALSDVTRLKIIKMLKDGEMCACKILEEFSITQPTLSHHLKTLCDSGVVECRKQGKWMHYSLNDKVLEECINALIGD